RPRRARKGPLAPALALDREQRVQQLACGKVGVAHHHAVKKSRLWADAERLGLVPARYLHRREHRGQPPEGVLEVGRAIAEIAAESDGHNHGTWRADSLKSHFIRPSAWAGPRPQAGRSAPPACPAGPCGRRAPVRRTASAPASRRESRAASPGAAHWSSPRHAAAI